MINMKKIITILAALIITANVWAQSPEKMSYQAVIRNSNDKLVANASVGIQISILKATTTGTAVYVERQFPKTNSNGLVSIEIGGANATVVSGNFSAINWANGPYFIKTETDLNGGSNYTISGTSQLLTVPYALHAKTAESVEKINITGNESAFAGWDKDGSDDFDRKYTSLVGAPKNISSFTNDVGYITNPKDDDADSTNEIQTLKIKETSISISGGNAVDLRDIKGLNTISIPAYAISIPKTLTIIKLEDSGLRWQQNYEATARFNIKKPANYNGGDVEFTIFFKTTTATDGVVDFFIRPGSFNSSDGLTDNSSAFSGGVKVSGTKGFGTLYEQKYIIPASKLDKDWWEIKIQRQGTLSTYTDDVILMSVALNY